jgi:hypothetical protein
MLTTLLYKRIEIPWFRKEKLESQMSEGIDEFYKVQIDDIMGAAKTLFAYKTWARLWIRISLGSI